VLVAPGDTLRIELVYRPDVFDGVAAGRIATSLHRVLGALAAGDDPRPSDFDLLSRAERQDVLLDWNATTVPPSPATPLQLFASQAAASPDAIAVTSGDAHLTYAALDCAAARVAGELRLRGIGREDRVGVCAGRGLAMAAGVLGILKAGAAFVPLDPSYPDDRLRYISADAGIGTIVTVPGMAARLPGGHPIVDVSAAVGDLEGDPP